MLGYQFNVCSLLIYEVTYLCIYHSAMIWISIKTHDVHKRNQEMTAYYLFLIFPNNSKPQQVMRFSEFVEHQQMNLQKMRVGSNKELAKVAKR